MLHLGDCRDILRAYGENTVDAIVTDPPYELAFMGKAWDKSGVSFDPNTWRVLLRVLKPGGHLLAFGGSRTYHRIACAIEDAGFEVRDQLQWLYGSGFPKSMNIGDGWGTALKPAHEPICLARKPLSEKTVAANVARWGTGALNIGVSRIPVTEEDRAVLNNRSGGQKESNTWQGPGMARAIGERFTVHENGRFPANILLDEDAARLLDEQSGHSVSTANTRHNNQSKTSGQGIYGKFQDQDTHGYADEGGASRFFYCAKASRKERGEGNTHTTVKPIALMRYLITLVTPPGGTVCDPFMGSGTTGLACLETGHAFIGIELCEEYYDIAVERLGKEPHEG